MTGKTLARDASGNPIKTPGWFSWRHKTREAHDAARERYLAEHGRAARRRKAAERQRMSDNGSKVEFSSVRECPLGCGNEGES